MHLCMNVIFGKLIPKGYSVRRNFSFAKGEKSLLNRCYRWTVDLWLVRRYRSTDFFFSLPPYAEPSKLCKIVDFAKSSNVELMVHPERPKEYRYLMSEKYVAVILRVLRGSYLNL